MTFANLRERLPSTPNGNGCDDVWRALVDVAEAADMEERENGKYGVLMGKARALRELMREECRHRWRAESERWIPVEADPTAWTMTYLRCANEKCDARIDLPVRGPVK